MRLELKNIVTYSTSQIFTLRPADSGSWTVKSVERVKMTFIILISKCHWSFFLVKYAKTNKRNNSLAPYMENIVPDSLKSYFFPSSNICFYGIDFKSMDNGNQVICKINLIYRYMLSIYPLYTWNLLIPSLQRWEA